MLDARVVLDRRTRPSCDHARVHVASGACRRACSRARCASRRGSRASVREVARRLPHGHGAAAGGEPALRAADARLVLDRPQVRGRVAREAVPDLLRRARQVAAPSALRCPCTYLSRQMGDRRNRQLGTRIGCRDHRDQGGGRRRGRARALPRPRSRRRGAGPSSTPTSCWPPRSRRPRRRWTAAAVVGVGVASMAETGVLTDDALRPVVPSIAWHDTRGEEEAAADRGRAAGLRASARASRRARCARWPSTPGCAGTGRTRARDALVQRRRVDRARPRRRRRARRRRWPRAPASTTSTRAARGRRRCAGRARRTTLAPPHAPAGTPLGRVDRVTRARCWRRGSGARRRRARPRGRGGRRGRGRRGRRARLLRHGRGDPARDGAARTPTPSGAPSPTASRSAATRSRAATSCRARSGRARSFRL